MPRVSTATRPTQTKVTACIQLSKLLAAMFLMGMPARFRPITATTEPRDHGRHEALDPARAHHLHDGANHGIDQAAGDDAAQRHADVGVGPLARVGRGRDHHADEGEARTQVAGHLAAGDEEEDQRADAAHQNGQVRVKAPSGWAPAPWRRTSQSRAAHPSPPSAARAAAHAARSPALRQHVGALFLPVEHSHGLSLHLCIKVKSGRILRQTDGLHRPLGRLGIGASGRALPSGFDRPNPPPHP